ncbi:hypothetical protein [Streptomyces scopuliridis]|uniref:hypothetical protein n=1 Tax=Streptomyces scopuliridis TaxID=452529 RepID=UPI0036AA87CB
MKQFRCSDGMVWTEQPDGTYRAPDPAGGYWQEPALETLELWGGPLTHKDAKRWVEVALLRGDKHADRYASWLDSITFVSSVDDDA